MSRAIGFWPVGQKQRECATFKTSPLVAKTAKNGPTSENYTEPLPFGRGSAPFSLVSPFFTFGFPRSQLDIGARCPTPGGNKQGFWPSRPESSRPVHPSVSNRTSREVLQAGFW